jgi:membrane protease YdiL (CAAX protease family)
MADHHPEPPSLTADPYWGGWPTIGLTALILFGVAAAYALGVGAIWLATGVYVDMLGAEGGLDPAGATNLLMALYWLGAVTGILLINRAVVRRGALSPAEYLDLRPIPHAALLPWVGVLAAYFALFVALPELTMARDGTASGLRPGGTFLYFVTAVTIAPLFEEMLFRGFIFTGLARARIGVAGAILLTTAMWTFVHRQFTVEWFDELYGLTVLFGVGVIFAVARVRTGSLYAAIALHAVWNATLLLFDATVLKRL